MFRRSLMLNAAVRSSYATIAKRRITVTYPAYASTTARPDVELHEGKWMKAFRQKSICDLLDMYQNVSNVKASSSDNSRNELIMAVRFLAHRLKSDTAGLWNAVQRVAEHPIDVKMLYSNSALHQYYCDICFMVLSNVDCDTPAHRLQLALHLIAPLYKSISFRALFCKKIPIFIDSFVAGSIQDPVALLNIMSAVNIGQSFAHMNDASRFQYRRLFEALSKSAAYTPSKMNRDLDPYVFANQLVGASSLLVALRYQDDAFLRAYQAVVLSFLKTGIRLYASVLGRIVFGLTFYGHGVEVVEFIALNMVVRYQKVESYSVLSATIYLAWSLVAMGHLPDMRLLEGVINLDIPAKSELQLMEILKPHWESLLPASVWEAVALSELKIDYHQGYLQAVRVSLPHVKVCVRSAGTTIAVAALVSNDGGEFLPWPCSPESLTPEVARGLPGVPVALLMPNAQYFLYDDSCKLAGMSYVLQHRLHQLSLSGWSVCAFLTPTASVVEVGVEVAAQQCTDLLIKTAAKSEPQLRYVGSEDDDEF